MLGGPIDMLTPDLVEPITGWRTWDIKRSYGQHVLVSPSQGTLWTPGRELVALCEHSDRAGCNCGVNAFAQPESLDSSSYNKAQVWGQVKLWGEVHQYEEGWRGQYAAPGEIYVNPNVGYDHEDLAAELTALYGVPVTVKAMPRHQAPKPEPSLPPGPNSREMRFQRRGKTAMLIAAMLVAPLWLFQGFYGWSTSIASFAWWDPATEGAPPYLTGTSLFYVFALPLIVAAIVGAVMAWSGMPEGGSALIILGVVVMTGAGAALVWNADDERAREDVSARRTADMVRQDAQTRSVSFAQHPLEWMREYERFSNGECKESNGIEACRKDGIITFEVIEGGKYDPKVKAERAAQREAEAERVEAEALAAAKVEADPKDCIREDQRGVRLLVCVKDGKPVVIALD